MCGGELEEASMRAMESLNAVSARTQERGHVLLPPVIRIIHSSMPAWLGVRVECQLERVRAVTLGWVTEIEGMELGMKLATEELAELNQFLAWSTRGNCWAEVRAGRARRADEVRIVVVAL